MDGSASTLLPDNIRLYLVSASMRIQVGTTRYLVTVCRNRVPGFAGRNERTGSRPVLICGHFRGPVCCSRLIQKNKHGLNFKKWHEICFRFCSNTFPSSPPVQPFLIGRSCRSRLLGVSYFCSLSTDICMGCVIQCASPCISILFIYIYILWQIPLNYVLTYSRSS